MGNIVTVNFRNDTLFAVERDDGVYVAVKPICDTLGIAWQSQHQRLKDDPVLSEGITTVVIPSPGGAQETTCLSMDMISGWLFKIDTRRVKEEARPKLMAYQRECYQVLAKHFAGKHAAPSPQSTGDTVEDAHENESVKLRMVNESRQVFGSQAAAQLWFRLGLPIVPAMLHDPRQLNLLDYSVVKSASEQSEAA